MRSVGQMHQKAESLLKGWLSEEARIERPSSRSDVSADLLVRDGRLTLVVELKRLADAGWLMGAIEQARTAARRVGRSAVPIVAVPFMGEVGRNLCAHAKVSWFDLSGNADIAAPGLRIYVEGKPNIFKRPGRPSTVFAPKSSRVVRKLLQQPQRAFQQRELARESVLDEGFTSRIVRKLEADRMIQRNDDGTLQVAAPDLLLDSWRENYDFSKHRLIPGHVTARSGEEALIRIGEALRTRKLDYAATGLSGAWLLTEFAMFRLVTFFVPEEPPENILKALGFRREERGANVWLVVPNDEGVFADAEERKGVTCVHPVQAYLDLKGHPERANEAAHELRKRLLTWRS
jgi:hypothetical protein